MALQATIQYAGVSISNAYLKVSSLSGNKNRVTFTLVSFNQQDGEQITKQKFTFEPDMNGENFIRQAYLHLKSLPEFSGAGDV